MLTVRLSGSSASNIGYVEVRRTGHPWGGICDDGTENNHAQGMKNADVVCKMAGFSKGAESYKHGSRLGNNGGDNILLDQVKCAGSEQDVFDCPHGGLGNEDCTSEEWFGVTCKV